MSKLEKPESKTGKRIVSKGQYAVTMGMKSMGAGLLLLCIVCLLLLLVSCGFILARSHSLHELASAGLFVLVLSAVTGGYLYLVAGSAIRSARLIESVTPLTRANTADLPAPESLVRASEQPWQAQEAILLRAATQGQQTPSEQLVRPAEGQEEPCRR